MQVTFIPFRVVFEDERPPAMHSALAWSKRRYINQMIKFASCRFQGIAGRSNIESASGGSKVE